MLLRVQSFVWLEHKLQTIDLRLLFVPLWSPRRKVVLHVAMASDMKETRKPIVENNLDTIDLAQKLSRSHEMLAEFVASSEAATFKHCWCAGSCWKLQTQCCNVKNTKARQNSPFQHIGVWTEYHKVETRWIPLAEKEHQELLQSTPLLRSLCLGSYLKCKTVVHVNLLLCCTQIQKVNWLAWEKVMRNVLLPNIDSTPAAGCKQLPSCKNPEQSTELCLFWR